MLRLFAKKRLEAELKKKIAAASATAAEDGGLLVFRAPAGDLSLSRVG